MVTACSFSDALVEEQPLFALAAYFCSSAGAAGVSAGAAGSVDGAASGVAGAGVSGVVVAAGASGVAAGASGAFVSAGSSLAGAAASGAGAGAFSSCVAAGAAFSSLFSSFFSEQPLTSTANAENARTVAVFAIFFILLLRVAPFIHGRLGRVHADLFGLSDPTGLENRQRFVNPVCEKLLTSRQKRPTPDRKDGVQ